jgi:hypothetical protein
MLNRLVFSQHHFADIDMSNTISGGQVVATITQTETSQGYEITVKIPKLKEHQLQIEIINDTLWLYQVMTVFSNDPAHAGSKSNTVQEIPIPPNVSKDGIHAHFEGGKWVIIMPFLDYKGDYRRTVGVY